MLDANFCLKLRQKTVMNDVRLGDGLSYYVANASYDEHIKNIKDEKEVRMH